jgi:DegV family protein with EDD domain
MPVESDTLPTTSQATPYQFEIAFQEAVDAGDAVVAITLSSKLSGTYQSAVIAAAEFPGKVFVVDSTSAAIGAGILIEYALQLVDRGLSAEDIAKSLLTQRERIYVVAMLDTLEYLKKGGRISKTVAFAGELLSIKPVVSIEGGEVKLLGKARGSKQGNNLLVKQIQAAGGVDFSMPLLLGYTGLSDVLLQKYITDSAILWEDYRKELPQTLIGSVIGTHVGPGAVAVAFFSKNET